MKFCKRCQRCIVTESQQKTCALVRGFNKCICGKHMVMVVSKGGRLQKSKMADFRDSL